jgi:hypothetical protein
MAAWAALAILCGAAWADLDTRPASRVHVRYVDGIPTRFQGGHAYSFILKVGQGRSAYLPCGHDNSQLLSGSTSFDGGQGDLERYYAQMLFFLAGYRAEPCGTGVDCEGLPVLRAYEITRSTSFSRRFACLPAP